MNRWLGPLLFTLLLVGGAGWVLRTSAEARDVSLQALRALFGFVSSPFILEATVASVGLLTVLTLNEYRRKKEEADEWVVMEREQTAESAKNSDDA
jgi:hypothetical protein